LSTRSPHLARGGKLCDSMTMEHALLGLVLATSRCFRFRKK